LFENTVDRDMEGKPTADYLWDVKLIVPFLKVDKGLATESRGVQLMKPMPELAALLDKAKTKRIFGTKMRSFVKQADEAGIKDIVTQQFEAARQIIAAGLVPIVEPEVDIHCPDKAKAEELLNVAIMEELDALPAGQLVMLKLTLPEKDDLYAECVSHPKVVRVVALSGGYTQAEGNGRLRRNHRCRGELFARAGRGAVRPAIRCRVQRPAGRIHSEHLRGVQHVSVVKQRTRQSSVTATARAPR
jgi:fructose-bisphosphate aldolase, class I